MVYLRTIVSANQRSIYVHRQALPVARAKLRIAVLILVLLPLLFAMLRVALQLQITLRLLPSAR
jgi:hypothetical protein